MHLKYLWSWAMIKANIKKTKLTASVRAVGSQVGFFSLCTVWFLIREIHKWARPLQASANCLIYKKIAQHGKLLASVIRNVDSKDVLMFIRILGRRREIWEVTKSWIARSPSTLALFPEARVDWKAWEGSAPVKTKCNFHGKQHQHPRRAEGQLEVKD